MIPKRIPKTYPRDKETTDASVAIEVENIEEPKNVDTGNPSILYGDSFSRSVAAIQSIDKISDNNRSYAETAVAQNLHTDINESLAQSIEADINIDDRSMEDIPTDAVPSDAYFKPQTHHTSDMSKAVCKMIREYINDDTLSIGQKVSYLSEIKTFCQYILEERYGVE